MTNQSIKLVDDLYKSAKDGLKKATTRRGVKDYKIGPAKLINADNLNQSITINISKVEVIKFSEIDNRLAQVEGYIFAYELKNALDRHYPGIKGEDFVSVVYFEVV